MSRACSHEPEAARGAAQSSLDGVACGPSAARREPTELSDEAEGGPLSHETERAIGGYSQPQAPCARFTSRTCSNRPLVARSDAVRPHGTPGFAELLTRRPDLEDGHEQG